MELIIADKISKGFGGPAVLGAASFRIVAGDSIGLVGPNGAGKTTLMKILAGLESVDSGRLERQRGLKVGYVEQSPAFPRTETIGDYLLRDVRPAQLILEKTAAELASASEESLKQKLAAYTDATERFEAVGGYAALDRGLAALSGLGLEADPEQVLSSLSGGERSLLQFSRALVSRPDLLILDEPGNHLDYLGLAWLERFLQAYSGTLLVISHNRYLLDAVCRTIWHLEHGELTCFTGNYTSFRTEWERLRAEREHEYRTQERKARELETRVKQLRSIASSQYNPPAQVLNKLGAAKRKLSETLEARGERPRAERVVGLDLGTGKSRADIALQFDGLDLSAGGRVLLEKASMSIACGERVALVGLNGSGKTTLVRRIVSEGDWNSGLIRIGPSLTVGYLSQIPHFSHPGGTILEEVRSWGSLSSDQAFATVAPFLFGYEDMGKRVGVLSGGEQNRLQFARLVYQGASFLILDEPTNHMDIRSREAIEAALTEFEGTLLVVSHDRYFLNRTVDRVVELHERTLRSYRGGFSDFFAARYVELPRLGRRTGVDGRQGQSDDSVADVSSESRRSADTDWEGTIARLEEELSGLQLQRVEAEDTGDRRRSTELSKRIDLLEERVTRAYRRWVDAD